MERSQWVAETRRLLEVEWEAENELAAGELDAFSRRRLQRLGKCVGFLRADAVKAGLYGRALVSFVSSRGTGVIDGGDCISTGDIVRVVPNNGLTPQQLAQQKEQGASSGVAPSGVVSKVSETEVQVAFDDRIDDMVLRELTSEGSGPLRLDKLPNDGTRRKQNAALVALEDMRSDHPAFRTSQVLFKEAEPDAHAAALSPDLKVLNTGLNEPQRGAIELALRSRDVALIHGPPGTGKTTAVVELIRQAAQVYGLRVLVCAPSNVAVDNIVLRLAPHCKAKDKNSRKGNDQRDLRGIQMVRVGHPARLLPQVLAHSLDAVLKSSQGAEVVNDVRSDLQSALEKLSGKKPKGSKAKKGKDARIDFRQVRGEVKELRKELRMRERKLVQSSLKGCNVVLSTNAGASSIPKLLGKRPQHTLLDQDEFFDLVIIDEAAQGIEASCWIPMLLGKRVVLAGDHKQLPPTIKSPQAAAGLLGQTLFDRIFAMYGDKVVRLLSIQYRMHQLINDWASHEMYQDKLLADESVAKRKIVELDHVSYPDYRAQDEEPPELATIVMIDTAGCDLEEAEEGDEDEDGSNAGNKSKLQNDARVAGSKYNTGEAEIVVKHVARLLKVGLLEDEIAVITPYNAQVQILRSLLAEKHPRLEVRSVDGFQGREKEAVVLSLVRSNQNGIVGFLGDDRRLNVAITRAMRHVCVVCDSSTLSSTSGSFLARMCEYFENHALVLHASDYIEGLVAGPSGPKRSVSRKPTVPKNGQPPKKASDEKLEEIRAEFREKLQVFARSEQQVLSFPSDLSSLERLAVHEIAGEMGLTHVSEGLDKDRFITVRKPPSESELNVQTGAASSKASPRVKSIEEEEEGAGHSSEEGGPTSEPGASTDQIAALADSSDDDNEDGDEDDGVVSTERAGSAQNEPAAASLYASPVDQEEARKAFSKVFLPRAYRQLLEAGANVNLAGKLSVQVTEKAWQKTLDEGQAHPALAIEAVQEAAAGSNMEQPPCKATDARTSSAAVQPEITPPPPPPQEVAADEPASKKCTKPKTELEKIRELQAVRFAAQKKAKADSWQSSSAGTNKTTASKKKEKSKGKAKGKKSKAKKSKPSTQTLPDDDDDDAFLDSMMAASKQCAYNDCSLSVQVQGATCEFCKLRWCYAHMQPEVHGCGSDASLKARSEFKSAARGGEPPKKMKSHQRVHLSRELNKKIAGEQSKRAGDSKKKR